MITCTKNDNCVLYALDLAIDPLTEIAILSSSDEVSPTKRYFIQRVSQEKPRQVPQEFKDLALDRKIHLVNQKEISDLEFGQMVTSAQSQ